MVERRRRRPPEPPPKRRGRAVTGLVAVAFLAIGSAATLAITGSQGRLDATATRAVAASDPVLDLCDDDSPVGEALRGDPGNPCGLAELVVTDPVPDADPVLAEPARPGVGVGPSTAQIQAAVRAELAANPPADGRPPTPAEVAAVVATFLTANPPAPGRSPTAAEIGAEVAQFFADNPVRDGQDGRPPTAEEIQTAVAAELAANPPRVELPSRITRTYPDGTLETCARNGGTDTAPIYDCGPRAQPDPDGDAVPEPGG